VALWAENTGTPSKKNSRQGGAPRRTNNAKNKRNQVNYGEREGDRDRKNPARTYLLASGGWEIMEVPTVKCCVLQIGKRKRQMIGVQVVNG